MIYFIIFTAEILLIFLFSRSLTYSVARLLYKISHNKTFTFNALAVIFLPGTIIHEISHMLVAGVLFVDSGDIQIFPEIDGNEIRFGSVKIAQTDPVRRFIIGVSPVIFGLTLILAVLFLGLQFLSQNTPWWQIALVVLLVFEIANTMFSSKKDMEGAAVFLGVLLIILGSLGGALYLTHLLATVLGWLSLLKIPNLAQFFQKSALVLLIPLGINLVLIGIAKILRV